MNDEWAKQHLPLLFVSHPIKLVPFMSPCFTLCWTMEWDELHLVPFRYVAYSVPIVSPGPCDTELHGLSCLLALNKTLFVLFGVITFPWLLWLWGFLTERIISMSALKKKKKKTAKRDLKKSEIWNGKKWTKVSHAEWQAALQPFLCQRNQKSSSF